MGVNWGLPVVTMSSVGSVATMTFASAAAAAVSGRLTPLQSLKAVSLGRVRFAPAAAIAEEHWLCRPTDRPGQARSPARARLDVVATRGIAPKDNESSVDNARDAGCASTGWSWGVPLIEMRVAGVVLKRMRGGVVWICAASICSR